MNAGRAALVVLAGLILLSIGRKKLGLEYDSWRIWHGVLSLATVALAAAHIQGAGFDQRPIWLQVVGGAAVVMTLFLLAYIRLIKPALALRKPYRVAAVEKERGDCWTVTMKGEGEALRFKPGQFGWLTLGSSPLQGREHPFSFAGSAEDREFLRFTIKELGDFTRTVKETKPGEVAYVDGPYGVFSTDYYPSAPGFGLVAGGVGIVPIMSILRTLADRRDRRPIYLIYGNSYWEKVLFREEIESLQGRLNLQVTHILQSPPERWSGETGVISEAIARKALPANASHLVYFLCGPKAMTEVTREILRVQSVPLHRIHFEHFEMV